MAFVKERRLACEQGEIVDAEGVCASPPEGLTADAYNAARVLKDEAVMEAVQDHFSALVAMHQSSLQQVKKYLGRMASLDEGQLVVDAIKQLDDDVRQYLQKLSTCSENATFVTREHLVVCANREQLLETLTRLKNAADKGHERLEKALAPLKSMTRAIKTYAFKFVTFGAEMLKKLLLLLKNHWKKVAFGLTLATITFTSFLEVTSKMIKRLDNASGPFDACVAIMKAVWWTVCGKLGLPIMMVLIYMVCWLMINSIDQIADMCSSWLKSNVWLFRSAGEYVDKLRKKVQDAIKEHGTTSMITLGIVAVTLLGPVMSFINTCVEYGCYGTEKLEGALGTIYNGLTGAAQYVVETTVGVDTDYTYNMGQLANRSNIAALQMILGMFQKAVVAVNMAGDHNHFKIKQVNFVDATTFQENHAKWADCANSWVGCEGVWTKAKDRAEYLGLPRTTLSNVVLRIQDMGATVGPQMAAFFNNKNLITLAAYFVVSVLSLAYFGKTAPDNERLMTELAKIQKQENERLRLVHVERSKPLSAQEAAVYYPTQKTKHAAFEIAASQKPSRKPSQSPPRADSPRKSPKRSPTKNSTTKSRSTKSSPEKKTATANKQPGPKQAKAPAQRQRQSTTRQRQSTTRRRPS